MRLMYMLVSNFGFAVLLFTLVIKGAMFPLELKQKKNMAVSQLFTPRVQEIQKKYRGNQAKMQEEMAKLQKEGYSPMGGCGTMLLTMLILFGVIDVVYKPMTHMERFSGDTIKSIQEISKQTEYTSIMLGSDADYQAFLDLAEIEAPREKEGSAVSDAQRDAIGKYIAENYAAVTTDTRFSESVRSSIKGVGPRYSGLQGEMHALLQYSKSPDAFVQLVEKDRERLGALADNMNFLGLNLGEVPQFSVINGLWFLAILSFVFSTLQMMVQQYIQRKTMPNAPNMKAMMLIGPVFSLFIVFVVPAGAGLYWAFSYLIGIMQSLIILKFWPPEKMRAEAQERLKAKLGVVEATATVEDVDEEGNTVIKQEKVSDMSSKEQKEYFRKKLEEARKADLEKYGEAPDIDFDDVNEKSNENTENNDNEGDN